MQQHMSGAAEAQLPGCEMKPGWVHKLWQMHVATRCQLFLVDDVHQVQLYLLILSIISHVSDDGSSIPRCSCSCSS